jgi:hypothetical protein
MDSCMLMWSGLITGVGIANIVVWFLTRPPKGEIPLTVTTVTPTTND